MTFNQSQRYSRSSNPLGHLSAASSPSPINLGVASTATMNTPLQHPVPIKRSLNPRVIPSPPNRPGHHRIAPTFPIDPRIALMPFNPTIIPSPSHNLTLLLRSPSPPLSKVSSILFRSWRLWSILILSAWPNHLIMHDIDVFYIIRGFHCPKGDNKPMNVILCYVFRIERVTKYASLWRDGAEYYRSIE